MNRAQLVVMLQGPVNSFVSNKAQFQGSNTPLENSNAIQSSNQ